MNIGKYLNKNKIGALVLIIVIIIAFGFGGFGGGFLSNKQNNIAKINKTNITTKDFIEFVNQSGISEKTIQENLDNNIIEELLSSLIYKTLLDLEIKDLNIKLSENSLSNMIKFNENFLDENGLFQRIKYEKFLLENNISAPIFEQRLKSRELQKKLFDFIGAGVISPDFLIEKLYKMENSKLEIDFINLNNFYKKREEINDNDLVNFINKNNSSLQIEYIDFAYSIINPLNLIGTNEFNQDFFDKIDVIENDILNGISFDAIINRLDLEKVTINDYKFYKNSDQIEKKIFELRNNEYDLFEMGENFIIYKINDIKKKDPNINDPQIKNEILNLVFEENKFNYNKELLKKINDDDFTNSNFLELGKDKIETITLNSIKDNKKFEINSVKILYSIPINSFTLISDENKGVYLAKIKALNSINFNKDDEDYKLFINKEKNRIKNSMIEAYNLLLTDKYDVNINQIAINNIKNIFQ
tara:strand:- start:1006 stop:2424 length:1419 start_codon:yes stop_codon:yes gene_type:complete